LFVDRGCGTGYVGVRRCSGGPFGVRFRRFAYFITIVVLCHKPFVDKKR
jgi:hypothetical protein